MLSIQFDCHNKTSKQNYEIKMSQETQPTLTEAQKVRIERNRAKALALKQAKLIAHPYAGIQKKDTNGASSSVIKVQGTKYIDSGGGFLIEQPIDASKVGPVELPEGPPIQDDAIAIPVSYEECLECGDAYADSFLLNNFSYSVCDKCHDPDGEHSLITRTEAKAEYLLKDCDFDKRDPPLKFMSRKNPHNIRWGEMKLYLHLQVQKRALEVWGSEDELVKQHENRVEKREVTKVKKYNKQMKQLRMEVRSSLFTKETKATHVHEYGEDTYNEDDDTYTHTCVSCGFSDTYEKM